MNLRLVFHILGALCVLAAAAMVPSLCLAFAETDLPCVGWRTVTAFGVGLALSLSLGLALWFGTRVTGNERITPSEGFAVVVLGWVLLTLLGGLPLYLCKNTESLVGDETAIGMSPGPAFHYIDACFETMSGFTTTGASVFGSSRTERTPGGDELGRGIIQALPKSFLFWRSLTHWLGGMGIVVLCLAILPTLHAGGYPLFQAEVPGPTADRLQPRIRQTAAILWGVYLLLSIAEALLLWLGDMPLFDSICHTFGTMATGGFSTQDASIGAYSHGPNGLYIEMVINLFMFLAGCNFLLHFQALRGQFKGYGSNPEFRMYCLVLGSAVVLLTLASWNGAAVGCETIGGALRNSLFQTLSITTTTGFCTADFNLWPAVARVSLVMLMFMGGCTGSTGGGIKQLRILVIGKAVYRELLRLLRPGLGNRIRVGGLALEERLVSNIMGLCLLWLMVFAGASLLVGATLPEDQVQTSNADCTFTTATTAVAATLNNIGPGLSQVGATCNYGWMPASTKLILILCMLMGRLEVYSVMVLFLPLVWRR